MTTETAEVLSVKMLRETARGGLGGGDRVKLRDGRTGTIVLMTYMLYSGKPPEYGIAFDDKVYEHAYDCDEGIPEAAIEEQLSIGRHEYSKPRTARTNGRGTFVEAEPRGICRRCGLKKSDAHPGAK